MFDPIEVKKDFPLFSQLENSDLVYLDNAATTQKPHVVLDAITSYYTHSNANVHRGIHRLSDRSTQAWLEARATIADFLGAQPAELILTRNATEAINGVALGWARHTLQPGDIVISSILEHHANLVPWQEICSQTGAELKLIPVLPDGSLDQHWFSAHLDHQVKLVTVQHVSNVLGTVHPIEQMVEQAHRVGALFLLDAAQSVGHLPVSFTKLGVDFLAFSGHKMLGPMGIGGLIVRQQLLQSDQFKPWLFGGGMISSVNEQSAEFHPDAVERFTAGTPDVASAVGLAAACDYLRRLNMSTVYDHDQSLVEYALGQLATNKNIQILGSTSSENRVGSVACTYQGVHPHDVAQVLDSQGVAVRSGHHCCMPLHQHLGIPGSVRASFSVYNAKTDIDRLVNALAMIPSVFKLK